MSDNYYDRSSSWVYDSDGNYLYSKRSDYNENIEREGYFYSDMKEWERRFEEHQKNLEERV